MINILEIEKQLIGTCIDYGNYHQAADYIQSHLVFQSAVHRVVWKAMQDMDSEGTPIDAITLNKYIEKNGNGNGVGLKELMDLADFGRPTHDVTKQCLFILEGHMRRQTSGISDNLKTMAENPMADIFETIDKGAGALEGLTSNLIHSRPAKIGELTKNSIEEAKRRVELRKEAERTGQTFTDGIASMISSVDELVNGFKGGRLYILAARPGMGKSAFAGNNICRGAALQKEPSLFKSLEMPKEELTDRMLCAEAGVSYGKFQKGMISDQDIKEITLASEVMAKYPIHIEDQCGTTITQIRISTRKFKREFGIKILIIDNINLIDEKGHSRENEMARISKGLKRLTIELNIPIVVISHLNRQCEGRDIRMPMLSDLRDSGAIEQDADCVIFLYRPWYYGEKYTIKAHAEVLAALLNHLQADDPAYDCLKELAFVSIAKNRGLRTGQTAIRFIGHHTRFEEWEDPRIRIALGLEELKKQPALPPMPQERKDDDGYPF